MELILSGELTIKYADKIIEQCVKLRGADADVILNLADATFVEPFAIAIIAGTVGAAAWERKSVRIKYVHPRDTKVNDFLSQIGFHGYFKINNGKGSKHTSLKLVQFDSLNPLYINELILFMKPEMGAISEDMSDSLRMSMQEILTNVFDHSKSKIGCFSCAQVYPNRNILRYCVADFGIGIWENLRKKYNVNDDIEAIKLAVNERVTSRAKEAGFGLSLIHSFIKNNEGTLTIVSGNGKVDFSCNNIKASALPAPFKGTIVNLLINTNRESNYYRIDKEDFIF